MALVIKDRVKETTTTTGTGGNETTTTTTTTTTLGAPIQLVNYIVY